MPNEYYLIRVQTLTAITNAISQVGLSADFPVLKVIAGKELYYIYHQTLVDIADTIRKKSGTTGEIPVTELAEKILALSNQPTGNTTAILGKAILGKAILGSSGSLKKLATPTIYLEETNGQLNAPIIRLEVVEEGDTPAITKLSTPTIYLEEIAEVLKLNTPIIYLETIDDSEPDEPEIVKLTTPNIWLEVVSDEPDEPVVVKLSAPNIFLETIEEHRHNYTSVVTAPTCTEQGCTTHTCAECGDEYIDSVTEALGHTWCDPYYSDEFSTGYGRKCERCGELEDLQRPPEKLDTPVIHLEEVIPHLDAPQNVKYDEDTCILSWDIVEGATYYMVDTDTGLDPRADTSELDFTAYFEKIYAPAGYTELTVTVTAHNADTTSEASEPVTIKVKAEEITELTPPTNVKYDATTKILSWDAVEGATHYHVNTDLGFGTPDTTLLEEDISVIFKICSNMGQPEVNVTVIACNESLMSEPSEPINFKILRKPTIELMEDEPEVIKLETPSIYLETI